MTGQVSPSWQDHRGQLVVLPIYRTRGEGGVMLTHFSTGGLTVREGDEAIGFVRPLMNANTEIICRGESWTLFAKDLWYTMRDVLEHPGEQDGSGI